MTFKQLFNKFNWSHYRKSISAIALILLAGALIELISLAQYNYAHDMVEEGLDNRAENEMTLKAVVVKSMLKSHEEMVRNYLWPIQHQLKKPDAIPRILKRLVTSNQDVMTCFTAFTPEYYPDRSRLFEPVAIRRGDSVYTKQVANELHDYTQREFYQQAVLNNTPSWSDPYLDADGCGEVVTTYAMPLTDENGKIVGTLGIDLSTEGIIDTLNTRHNFPSTFYLLLTEDGKLISKPDSSHTQQSDVDAVVEMINDSTCQRELSSSCRSKVITFESKEKGTGYAYHAFMKGHPHWQVVMVCYDDEVFGKLNDLRRNMLLLMLGAFSLLGFILYRVHQYVKRLHESRLNKERTDSELHIAQKIQSEMLPQTDITRPDVDVSGKQVSALEVGGDLYDYFIRDEKLFFCIGDVSGKGVPSSLVMAVVHSLFRSLSRNESNPSRIMHAINEEACEGNDANMFVTMFIGVLDLPTGRLRYCNAGHDAPLIIDHEVRTLKVNPNLPLGLFSDTTYLLQEEQLPRESALLLYTDGLTEMADTNHNLFGLQRIIETAQANLEQGKVSPSQLMGSQHEGALRFANGAQQSDDLTMLCVHYHHREEHTVLDETIKLSNDVHQVPELNNFVKSVSERLNLESSLSSQLMLAVEEAVVNVMSYAYPIGTQGDVTITAKGTDNGIKFIIIDEGKAFDPTMKSEADTTLSAEERPIGGLGILLVQSLMDSVNYERIDGKNVLTIMKNYNNKQ